MCKGIGERDKGIRSTRDNATDRGSQFMGREFRWVLESAGIKASAGERGYKDNIYMERFLGHINGNTYI